MSFSVEKEAIRQPNLEKSVIVPWVPDQADSSQPFAIVGGRRIRPSGSFELYTVEECMLSEYMDEYRAEPVPNGKRGSLPREANLVWHVERVDLIDEQTKMPIVKYRGPWAEIEVAERQFHIFPSSLLCNGWSDVAEGLEELDPEIRERILVFRKSAEAWRWLRPLPRDKEEVRCRLYYNGHCSYGGQDADVAVSIMAYPI